MLRTIISTALLVLVATVTGATATSTSAGGGTLTFNDSKAAIGVNAAVWQHADGATVPAAELAGAAQTAAPELRVAAVWMLQGGWQFYLPALPSVATLGEIAPVSSVMVVFEPDAVQTAAKSPQSLLTANVGRGLADVRADHGLATLRESDALTRAAQGYADYLRDHDFPATGGSDPHMQDGAPWDRAARAGYGSTSVSEVLVWMRTPNAVNPPADAVALVQSWMDSAPHRAIILDPDQADVGVGCSLRAEDGGWTVIICVAKIGR